MSSQYSPGSRNWMKLMALRWAYSPAIQRKPCCPSRCSSSRRHQMYSPYSSLRWKSRFSRCRRDTATSPADSIFSILTEGQSGSSDPSRPASGLPFRIMLLLQVQNLKGAMMWTARQSSGRLSKVSDLLLKDSAGSRQVRVSQEGLVRRGMNPLSPNNSPTARVSPAFSSRFACCIAFAVSSSLIRSFFRPPSLRSWMRRLGVPASSSANSTRLPSCRASQREQQLAQAFSRRNGQMSTGPSSGSRTLKNAGRAVAPVRTTGMQSSMMIYFQTLSWQMRRRYTPKALTPCPSKIFARSCGLPARQFIAPARYSCAQLSALAVTSTRCWPTRARVRPLKSSGNRIQLISSPIFSRPFLVAKTEEATGGKISSLYLKGLATGCLGSVWQVAAEKRLLRVEGWVWASACRRATIERYFCLMILLVLFSLSCLSARPRPEATEQERSRSLEPSRLRLRMLRPFLRMEGLRSFSFRRMPSPLACPSMIPPKRTSLGSSGHSDCLLSSVLISSSRFSRSHSGKTGALSMASSRSPSRLFLEAGWTVLQIFCSLDPYL